MLTVHSPESPFVPVMAARIRPSLDEGLLLDLSDDEDIQRNDGGDCSGNGDGVVAEAEPIGGLRPHSRLSAEAIVLIWIRAEFPIGEAGAGAGAGAEANNGISVAVPPQGKLLEKAVTVQLAGEIKSFSF
ncbi:hypothetical protein Ancab_033347 [Ancistrocladus abbreviatus]